VGAAGAVATFVLERFYYPLGFRHLLWAALGGLALGVAIGGVNLITLSARGGAPSATSIAEILGIHVWGGFGFILPWIVFANCALDTGLPRDVVAVVVELGARAPTFEVEANQPYAGLRFSHPNDPRLLSFSNARLFRGDRRKFTVHPGRLGLPWASAWQDFEPRS